MTHSNRLYIIAIAGMFWAFQSGNYAAAERHCFDHGWQFAYGHGASPQLDFGCGTEYFNYLTKANSIHNEGPYSPKFDPAKWGKEWVPVSLPHDWVVDLPYDSLASHSHGYKTVGYNYPANSVGWYRKTFTVPADAKGQHVSVDFDAIFRDARVWVNGFYLGGEPSGYAQQHFDISEYLNYGGDNLIAVRADATLEEGWYYEGAGIYGHAYLNIDAPVHVAHNGIFAYTQSIAGPEAAVGLEITVDNKGLQPQAFQVSTQLVDHQGNIVASAGPLMGTAPAKGNTLFADSMVVVSPTLWTIDNPYLYTLQCRVTDSDGAEIDREDMKIGIRTAAFDSDRGFLLNGQPVKLKGVNLHQDHAGVGVAIPDALHAYRLQKIKAFGANAVRSSHNPMLPAMLSACDSLGIMVIAENRLAGINDMHVARLENMIKRDRNHPSVILWSLGNEEWGIEWNEYGERIAASMSAYAHRLDPTRPVTFASSSGPTVLTPVDVAGYNYILQNPVDEHRANYPQRCAVGTEETTATGTRYNYYDAPERGLMMALNRKVDGPDSIYNAIERGWKFYASRPWLAGLFYWTGFDHRGEPNPLVYPATGAQKGILDYCGFAKDEAEYLRAWWTTDPVLHILPHWTLPGHEGETVSVWAYSNCDEVEVWVNGKSLGRQRMPRNGHLEWPATYRPGTLKAVGYKNGKRVLTKTVRTAGPAAAIAATAHRQCLAADNADVAVVDIDLLDGHGTIVPDACPPLTVTVAGAARILGAGNGNPAFLIAERPAPGQPQQQFSMPAFNGHAQFLVQSDGTAGPALVTIDSPQMKSASVTLNFK